MKTEEEKLKIAQIVKKITHFVEERDWSKFHHPKEMASAIAIEYMELLEFFLDNSSLSKTDLEDEIGDVYFGLASLYNCLHIESIPELFFPPLSKSFLPPIQLLLHFGVTLGRLMEHFQWLYEEQSRSMVADLDLVSSYVSSYSAFYLFCKSVNIDPYTAFFNKIEKTAVKYPPEKVFSDRDKYVSWKKELKKSKKINHPFN